MKYVYRRQHSAHLRSFSEPAGRQVRGLLLWQQERRDWTCERQSWALTCRDTTDLVESSAHRSGRVKASNTTREALRQQSGTVGSKDIEQQAGDVCDAVAVFPEVSVSLCRIEALQQPQQDWKQHFYEAQHTVRHTVPSQRLLDREQEGHTDRKSGEN